MPVELAAPDAQRLVVQLMRNDGTPYEHAGSKATALAYDNDGEAHVAILSPWPGSTLVLPEDEDSLEVEVRTFNFDPQAIDIEPKDGVPDGDVGDGHIHLFNDGGLPECATANNCSTEISVYRPTTMDTGILPIPADATQLNVGALLVNALHCPYVDGAEVVSECVGAPDPIFDEVIVEIERD